MLRGNLILNCIPKKAIANPEKNLHKSVEVNINLTGYCNTYAVIIDGKAVMPSCKYLVAKAGDEKITTKGEQFVLMALFINDSITCVVTTSEAGIGPAPSKTKVTHGTAWIECDPGRRFKGTNCQGPLLLCWGRNQGSL